MTEPEHPLDPPRPWWIFSGRELLLREDAFDGEPGEEGPDPRPTSPLGLPESLQLRIEVSPAGAEVAGDATDAAQAIHSAEPPPAPPGFQWVGLRAAASALGDDAFRRAGRAWQLLEWRRTHRFCGVCGSATRPGAHASLQCSSCDHLHFPRLSPAVIVLVHDGDRILLGRSPAFPEGMFSTLAGFVEPGESLEAAVRREIREEADVEVADPVYFGSQPWPFPHSLMIGFFARWVSGTPRPADGELEAVEWFSRHDLPPLPGRVSIARHLIETWRADEAR